MLKVLLVSHRGERCGVQQYGRSLHGTLAASGKLGVGYRECSSEEELEIALKDVGPGAVIFNYHPSTLPWLTPEVLRRVKLPTFGIVHEVTQETADTLNDGMFDFHLCPDPVLLGHNPSVLPVPRFIPDPVNAPVPPPGVFTIGSFGFATAGKGFDRLCRLVNEQFDTAVIRLNVPPHDDPRIVIPAEAAKILDACRAEVTKPGITLELTDRFMSAEELVSFLARNTLNAFLYDQHSGRGISSCTDYALAAGRPIAISKSGMFRHLLPVNPSICVEDLSLAQIAENGFAPLLPLQHDYRRERAGAAWASVIGEALHRRTLSMSAPDGRGFNKLLDDRSRAMYREALRDLERRAPEPIGRKNPQDEIQQAFALDAVERFSREKTDARILAIGSAAASAVAVLRSKGYRVDVIDPSLNFDLSDYYLSAEGVPESCDIVLCVSVLERVLDDELFVRHAAELLAPGGIAIFTVDFRDGYVPGMPKPLEDCRLYSARDLVERLMSRIQDCALVDKPLWHDAAQAFARDGAVYDVATWVFRKLPAPWREYRGDRFVSTRTTPWKEQLVVEFPDRVSPRTRSDASLPEYLPRYGSVRPLTDVVIAQEQRLAEQEQVLVERQERLGSLRAHLDKAIGAIDSVRTQLAHRPSSTGRPQGAGPEFTPRELLSLHGRDFVVNSYRTLLGRAPDQSGLEFHVELLRRGASRLRLIRSIRYSPEGRIAGVDVGSVGFEILVARLYGLPLVGRLIREVAGLIGLAGETTTQRAREIEAIEDLNRTREEKRDLQDKLIRVEEEIARYRRGLSGSELLEGRRLPASFQPPAGIDPGARSDLSAHSSPDGPLLSLCITTYNRSSWLRRSLDNVLPQLSGLEHLVELVVCDNASADDTEELMKEYRGRPVIRYVRNRANVGMLGNLAVTAGNARGKFVWILGDDDIMLKGTIESLLRAMIAFPEIEFIYTNYAYTHSPDPNRMSLDELLNTQAPISPPSPEQYVSRLRDIAGYTENFFTAIYCCIFRADHASACFSQDTRGRPFSSLPTCVPTAQYVLDHLLDRPAYWLGSAAVLVNMNVSWLKHADLWMLERLPEIYERFQKAGVAPARIDHYRKNNLPGVMHYLENCVARNSENLDIIDLECLFRTYRHLEGFQALLPEIRKIIRTRPEFAARIKFAALGDQNTGVAHV